jgi:hypothetical protein
VGSVAVEVPEEVVVVAVVLVTVTVTLAATEVVLVASTLEVEVSEQSNELVWHTPTVCLTVVDVVWLIVVRVVEVAPGNVLVEVGACEVEVADYSELTLSVYEIQRNSCFFQPMLRHRILSRESAKVRVSRDSADPGQVS